MALSAEEIERVYLSRYAPFRHGAAAILGGYEDAGDVVQEAFARALVERRRFRGGSPEAWVWRIVQRRALDERRRRGRLAPLDDVDAALVASTRDPDLAAAVRDLPPRRRLIVFLRYFADLPYDAIADLAGVAEGTVAAA